MPIAAGIADVDRGAVHGGEAGGDLDRPDGVGRRASGRIDTTSGPVERPAGGTRRSCVHGTLSPARCARTGTPAGSSAFEGERAAEQEATRSSRQ